jgi:uncharacterized membrane protein YphA (DoxX/SURF4 family)
MPSEINRRQLPLALLRIAIGWHFLYEGWTKLMLGSWSSSSYLNFATGPFGRVFHWMGSNQRVVGVIDQLNIWGLTLIGLALVLGVFTRAAALGGMALLALYYLAYPPLFAPVSGVAEGQYLIVNKNLVELFALAVVVAFPAAALGLDGLLARRPPAVDHERAGPDWTQRREMIAAFLGLPVLGGFALAVLRKHGWRSFEEAWLRRRSNPDDVIVATATASRTRSGSLRDLKGVCPQGRIGKVQLSRLILGGNLIAGVSHSRDLIYVSRLMREYNNRQKVFETFDLAESCGVNAILLNSRFGEVVEEYRNAGGKVQFVGEGWTPDGGAEKLLPTIRHAIDYGAIACYISGATVDRLVEQKDFNSIEQVLDLVRRNGLPMGIGGHHIETIKACVERGLRPEFWLTTLHPLNYWSAHVQPEHENIWCTNPEETIAYMRDLPEPWIAFKTLAAGALEPKDGFRYAFENGADFICAGMYDFQIVDNVNVTLDVLNGGLTRARNWRA